ncbi:MAG: aminodeoxychorismate synthase component I [Myxococcota bacterium]|nr:aminodeoxychorismate synthase component I [Myxococcota bacterium]
MSSRVLLIDHYDSFTYNLAHLIAQVTGCAPRVVAHDAPMSTILAEPFDAIVLSPGPGRPDRSADFASGHHLIHALQQPLLGVCLGHQGLAHAYGARIAPAAEPVHGRPSLIHHDGKGIFRRLRQPFKAIRYHSLCAVEMPDCLDVTAWSEDGVVMGVQHRIRPQFGIQFHPESIGTEDGAALMDGFMAYVHSDNQSKPAHIDVDHVEASSTPCVRYDVQSRRIPWRDPEAAFATLFADSTHGFWLDSTRTDETRGRFSYMGATGGPLSRLIGYNRSDSRVRIHRETGVQTFVVDEFFPWFRQELNLYAVSPTRLPFEFQGGWVGYLGYELKAETGGDSMHESSTPDAEFIFVDRCLIFDHGAHILYLLALVDEGCEAAQVEWLARTAQRLQTLSAVPAAEPVHLTFRLPHSDDVYRERIRQSLRQIREGESYEVCLTTHLVAEPTHESFALYRALRAVHDVPFAAYFKTHDVAVASMSPERFLRISPCGLIEAHPIKGTAPRGQTPAEDDAAAHALKASVKDRSENLMIVDLLRNDLSRVCRPGSVHVPRLMEVESYAVHQLVSEIRGHLRPNFRPIDAVISAFPGGSMTGAPKRRTMSILDAIETESRGIYSGALGYFSLTGAIDLSIVIRTAVMTENATRVGVGGAIVALSNPEEELAEIYLKGRTVTAVLSE